MPAPLPTVRPCSDRVPASRAIRLLATLVIATGATAPAAAAQLIVNGGFESGDFTGWTRFGARGFTAVGSDNPFEGDFAAGFSPNAQGGILQIVETLAGARYKLSFWFAHEGGTATPINLLAISFGGVPVNSFSGFGLTPYTHVRYTLIGGGPKALAFTFRDARPTRFFLDAVSLTGQVPEPASWAMLVTGFGLAGALARRRRSRSA